MADPQFQLDQPPSFEIPKATQYQVQPAVLQQPQQSAGYIGKPGVAAAIASSVLEGWMTGTRIKEQRQREQAQMSLDGARYGYAQSIEALRNWRMENNDPNTYKDTQTGQSGKDAWNKKYQLLVADAQNSQKLYADMMGNYVIPKEEKAKGAGGKIKAAGKKLASGFTAQTHFLPQQMLDVVKGQNVENLSAPDPLRAAQYRAATTEEKAAQEQLKAQESQNKLQQKLMDANESLAKAAQSNDYTQMANAMNTVNALSGHADKMITPEELKGRAEEVQVKAQQSSTLKGIFDKVGTGKPLTDNEQAIYNAAWGIPPEKQVFQAYLDEVGPGKKFSTRYDAARQYLEDQSSFKNAYRPDTLTEMEEKAMSMYLTEKLGRAPTPGELGEGLLKYRFGGGIEGMGDFKPNAEGKIPAAQSRQAVSRAIEAVIGKNSDYQNFAIASGSAAGGVTYSFRPNYQADQPWYLKVFGDEGAVDDKHTKFMNDISAYLSGQGYSTDQIRQMMGAVRFGMEESPQPGQPQTNTTPSSRDLRSPKKQYRVTKGGKSTTRSLSQDEVDALRGTPGFDVQPL